MEKYRTGGYGKNLIEEVEIIRETKKQVVLHSHNGRERRVAKRNAYYNYFDDWQSAKDFLLLVANLEIKNIKLQLERANNELCDIEALHRDA